MFFYRAWAGNEDRYPQSPISNPDIFTTQFAYHRWGYAALLGLTLVAGLGLNLTFLSSFISNWATMKRMPHLVLFMLSIRDLIVALILIPICIDWYIVNAGAFTSGYVMCKFSAFLDYAMAAEYAILIIIFSIILYTRKFPKLEDTLGMEQMPMEEIINIRSPPASQMGSRPPSVTNQHLRAPSHSRTPSRLSNNGNNNPNMYLSPPANNGRSRSNSPNNRAPHSRTPSRQGGGYGQGSGGSRAPSVAGSVDGYRKPTPQGNQSAFRPQRPTMLQNTPPKRPGSVTGSIEGRLATSTPSGKRPQYPSQFGGPASSPIHEADEDMDLWEAASLDYPGRNSPGGGWEFMEEEDEEDLIFYDEPRYHTWHYWLLGLTWVLALGIGVPAAMVVEYRPDAPESVARGRNIPSRPGCYIPADPFKNPYSATVNDPGFNFTLSFLIICYLFTVVIMVVMFCLTCYRETKNAKWKRHFKILGLTFVVFMISRSAIDILQLKGLIEAAMGFKQLNVLAYEMEYEILLVWSTYIPLFAHPILYFSFVGEYRQGGLKIVRTILGTQGRYEKKQELKMDNYKSDEILSQRSNISKTQTTNML